VEVRFAAKLTRSSKKMSPDKKYVVIIREAEGGGS